MPHSPEVFLFVGAEADLAPGIALAARIGERSGFDVRISVVSENPALLLEQVKSRLSELDQSAESRFTVESLGTELEPLLEHLERQASLRLLLVSGLDQLNDNRKALLRRVAATVVCFEPHPGLLADPTGLWLVGEDHRGAAFWLCEHMLPHAQLSSTSIAELQASARPSGEVESEVSGDAPAAHGAGDLVFVSAAADGVDGAGRLAKSAIEVAVGPVILVRGERAWFWWLLERKLPGILTRYVPQMSREERRSLASDLSTYSQLDFEFIALICAATFLASFGLLQDSAAVIIGAMLVAPLMTPLLGAGLSLAQGNRPLFINSLRTIAIGFLAALLTSALFGFLVRLIPNSILIHTESGVVLTGEMWSRTSPSIIDFFVGLVGGSAAAFARTRGHLSAALAGAAIAAALVPPIATAGLQISLLSWPIAATANPQGARHLVYGPMLLFLANMLTIMIGSSFVLWGCGIRREKSYSLRDRWATRTSVLLLTLTALIAVWIVQHP